jgi:hypothetical protein
MIPGRLLAVISLCGLLLAAGMQNRYDSRVDYFAERNAFVSLPSGEALKVLSFGYNNLVADMLFIWAIQFYSTPYLTNRFDFLERVYETITDITPATRACIIGSLIRPSRPETCPWRCACWTGSRHNPDSTCSTRSGLLLYKCPSFARAAQRYERAA